MHFFKHHFLFNTFIFFFFIFHQTSVDRESTRKVADNRESKKSRSSKSGKDKSSRSSSRSSRKSESKKKRTLQSTVNYAENGHHFSNIYHTNRSKSRSLSPTNNHYSDRTSKLKVESNHGRSSPARKSPIYQKSPSFLKHLSLIHI